MVTIQSRDVGYRILLNEGETIKILVNDIERFSEAVSPGMEGKFSIKFQESRFEE